MQKIALIIAILVSGLISAQSNYVKGMNKAFDLWSANNYVEAGNLFERISEADADNWLPSYYAAQINIIYSFGEQNKEKLNAQLSKGQELLDKAMSISPGNPELLVMQALLHTAWVAFDGATYGMTLSGKITALYTEAEQLDPENPRVIFSKAEWAMGSARFFGQDTSPFCKDVERALDLFANFKPESEFHPNWGENRAKEILESCNK